jgi:hypothetical protein
MRMRPSSLGIAPARVRISTPEGGASAKPICSSASSAAWWMRCTPASLSGL